MTDLFPVPRAYRGLDRSPQRDAWCDRLPARAADLAQRWGLTPDGAPMYGFLSVVWPVRNHAGRPLALKIHDFTAGTDGERLALAAAPGPGWSSWWSRTRARTPFSCHGSTLRIPSSTSRWTRPAG